MKPIPYGRQQITDEDIAAVVEVLRSDYLTQGPVVAEFEEAFAKYVDSSHAVAVSNGTAALHLACLALDVIPGQRVITTPISFAASANCVCYCSGIVEFVDIDPVTYLLDIELVRQRLRGAPKGTYRGGIVVVDFAGLSVDLQRYRELADEFGLWIIEDACHAAGGFFVDSKGVRQNCGNGKFADLSVFSFHPVKHIAAGEGGMITTNNSQVYKRLLSLRSHGIAREAGLFINDVSLAIGGNGSGTSFPGWYMEMQELGFNYRLTDFQCALGMSQLRRADAGLARRRELARSYDTAFALQPAVRVLLPDAHPYKKGHAYHLYVVEVEARLELYNYLRSHEIYPQVHYLPIHLMPYYRQMGFKRGDFPVSESYYSRCLSLPLFPTLTDEQQAYIIQTINEFYRGR